MSQAQRREQPAEELPEVPLFELAADLEAGAEGVRRRRERKRLRLLAAGVISPPDDPPDAWVRHDDTLSGPPSSYPRGVSPVTGDLHEGA